MKKYIIFIATAVAVALGVLACTTISNGGQGSGSPLIGTWTGTDSDGAIVTLTFTDATNGTGTVVYGGVTVATLKLTCTMTDATSGAGAVIITNPSYGKQEVESFTFTIVGNQLFVSMPDGDVVLTRTGGQPSSGTGTNPGLNPGQGLVGTTWRWTEDESDEYTQIKFETASTGSGFIYDYDEGEVFASFNFTYTMSSATAGSGTLYMTDYYGQTQSVPFTFTVIGNDLYFTATIGSETATTNFKKVS